MSPGAANRFLLLVLKLKRIILQTGVHLCGEALHSREAKIGCPSVATIGTTGMTEADIRPGPNHRVYVVDDDAQVLRSLVTYLKMIGYSARGFESAEALLESIEITRQLSCIVTDVRMPDMSGMVRSVISRSIPGGWFCSSSSASRPRVQPRTVRPALRR